MPRSELSSCSGRWRTQTLPCRRRAVQGRPNYHFDFGMLPCKGGEVRHQEMRRQRGRHRDPQGTAHALFAAGYVLISKWEDASICSANCCTSPASVRRRPVEHRKARIPPHPDHAGSAGHGRRPDRSSSPRGWRRCNQVHPPRRKRRRLRSANTSERLHPAAPHPQININRKGRA